MRKLTKVAIVAITTTAGTTGMVSGIAGANATQTPPATTCETALYPANSGQTCTSLEMEAYSAFGARLPALYAAAPTLPLGSWAPLSTNDTSFNYFALMACQYLVSEFSELGWLEEAADIDGPTMADNEAFFDAAMTHVCPELNYRRQLEWDTYIPFDLFDAPTTTVAGTAVPQVPTTLPGAVTTFPVVPPTTFPQTVTVAPTLPPAQPTTPAGVGSLMVLSGVDSAGNPVTVDHTCSELNDAVLDPPRSCDQPEQAMFDRIINTNGQAFQTFVELASLGNFSTLPDIGHESRAWMGLVACVIRSTNPADLAIFDEYARGIFTATTPGDTQLVWNEAQRVLCPFVA